jgi:hypothetical protein
MVLIRWPVRDEKKRAVFSRMQMLIKSLEKIQYGNKDRIAGVEAV